MNSEFKLTKNTVQETLLIPLWGRKICTEKFPKLFPVSFMVHAEFLER